MTSNNMYRVGDFVFFEASASAPYQIRRIEELNKTSSGAVKAKVACFYRRRDVPPNLIHLADTHQQEVLSNLGETLDNEQIHQLRHRELFLSRYLEVLPATHIRGKCQVSLSDETEPYLSYIGKEDSFFFQLVYDPVNKTLQADKGSIRIGDEYQAVVPERISTIVANGDSAEHDDEAVREQMVWAPPPSDRDLTTGEMDAYLMMCKSLGTLARACYPPTALPQPSLVLSAAAASRDTTLQHGLDTLYAARHDVTKALALLAPNAAPVIRLDEMEEWSLPEGSLFEEALEKYGKSFYDIQSDFLPWKSAKSVVVFYYMWKTTDHYLQQKRTKALEAERKLKQVYIPNYNKPNQTVLYPSVPTKEDVCEAGCGATSSPQWYSLGPLLAPIKVCVNCWTYWKRYGDLQSSLCAEKLMPMTMVYRCPVKACDEEFDDKHFLALHLDSQHPQYGSACASPVQPTVSLRSSNKLSCLNGGRSTNSPTMSESDAAAALKTRIGSNFYFHACPALRLARRLCPVSPSISRKRRLYGRTTKPPPSPLDINEFKATAVPLLKALSEESLADLRQACFSRMGSRSEDIVAAASRLHAYTDIIQGCRTTRICIDEPDCASEINSSSNDVTKKTCVSESNHLLKRPAALETLVGFGTKKSRCTDSPVHSSQQSHTRETSFGVRVPRAETLMFLAATALKNKRRKLIPSAAHHRLCRRPWSYSALPTELRSLVDRDPVVAQPTPPVPSCDDVDIPDSN